MITAKEALQLPSAQLTEEDQVKVKSFLDGLEASIRAQFDSAAMGLQIPVDGMSNKILATIARKVREAGWAFGFEQLQEKSSITGELRVVALRVMIEPAVGASS